MKRLFALGFVVSLLLLVASYAVYRYLYDFGHTRVALIEPVIIEYPRGTSFRALSSELERGGIVQNAKIFRLWARLFESTETLQAGRYRFEESTTPIEVLATLRSGDIYRPEIARITFPEGLTIKDAARIAALHSSHSEQSFIAAFSEGTLLGRYGITASTLEGYIFPLTYVFYEDPTPDRVASMAVETFFNRAPSSLDSYMKSQNMTFHDGVILASMIEVETRWDEERPLIAEVIWSRLKKGMSLGIDAAIIYGIKDYKGQITFAHLRDKSNPYNLRLHRGLPPTPISSPSYASLEAVMNPTSRGYLYYVLDPERGTWHTFTKSLREHSREVHKLVQAQKRAR